MVSNGGSKPSYGPLLWCGLSCSFNQEGISALTSECVMKYSVFRSSRFSSLNCFASICVCQVEFMSCWISALGFWAVETLDPPYKQWYCLLLPFSWHPFVSHSLNINAWVSGSILDDKRKLSSVLRLISVIVFVMNQMNVVILDSRFYLKCTERKAVMVI